MYKGERFQSREDDNYKNLDAQPQDGDEYVDVHDVLSKEELEKVWNIIKDNFSYLSEEEQQTYAQNMIKQKFLESLPEGERYEKEYKIKYPEHDENVNDINVIRRAAKKYDNKYNNKHEEYKKLLRYKEAKPEPMTTDVFTSEQLSRLRDDDKTTGRIILENFYKSKYAVEDNFGYPPEEVDSDRRHVESMNYNLGLDEENDVFVGIGKKVEDCFPYGMLINGWTGEIKLGKQEKLKPSFHLEKFRSTFPYDDLKNHIDWYCRFKTENSEFPIGFDVTARYYESDILKKLEQFSSSKGQGVLGVPIGYGVVKYCEIDGVAGEFVMPRFIVGLDYDDSWESKDEDSNLVNSISYLSQVGNKKIFSDEDFKKVVRIRKGEESKDDDFLSDIKEKAENLRNLDMSFFVLSEMYEQCGLALDKDQKNKEKTVFSRAKMMKQQAESLNEIQNAVWQNLCQVMRKIVDINGETDNFVGMSYKALYDRLKQYAGVGVDDEMNDENHEGEREEHYFGLRRFVGKKLYGNRSYVGLMNAISIEQNETTYTYCEVGRHNGKMRIIRKIGRIEREMDGAETPKEKAREIFSKITFDSYRDNFDSLFELAKKTETVNIFLSRLRMGRFNQEKGVFEGGYEKAENSISELGEKPDDSEEMHDGFIEELFSDEKLREKFFRGKNRTFAAGCFSDKYLKDEGNLKKLLSWGVSEGKVREILARSFELSPERAQNRLDDLKQELKQGL